jgi:ferrous iron transport protein A
MSRPTQPSAELITLDLLPVGEHARIERLNGGREMTRRLLSLGLRVGSVVDVLQHRGHGVVVASHGSRVALGGGVAAKILMLPLTPDAEV